MTDPIAPLDVKPRPSPFYADPYNPHAEFARGRSLMVVFAVLLAAVLFLWVWFHVPDLLRGRFAWVYPTLSAADGAKTFDADRLGRGMLDWVLAALSGALVFGLNNLARHMPRLKSGKAEFRAFTGWYLANLVQSPIIAVVVMLLLTNLTLAIGPDGFSLDFSQMPAPLLTGIAFILGYYGHVAKAQLDQITSNLFSRAWLAAEGRFKIAPATPKVIYGRQQQFTIDPPADVTWSASPGSIDASGLYTAPARDLGAAQGTKVQVRAALRSDPTVSDVVTFALLPFVLSANKLEMKPGESQELFVDNRPASGVLLEADYGTIDGLKYTAPARDDNKASGVKAVTITARPAGQDAATRFDSDTVTIRLKADGQP